MDPTSQELRNRRSCRARRRGTALLLATVVALAACEAREAQPDVVTETEFIAIVVALREAERGLDTDSAEEQFERRKADILAEFGATEEDLRAFLVRRHQRSRPMATVWDSVAERLHGEAPPGGLPRLEPPIEDVW